MAWRRLSQWVCRPQPCARCWLCGGQIIYGLRPRHPSGPSADHVTPLNKGGDLLDPANVRLAHYGCNSARHDDDIIVRVGTSNNSRRW